MHTLEYRDSLCIAQLMCFDVNDTTGGIAAICIHVSAAETRCHNAVFNQTHLGHAEILVYVTHLFLVVCRSNQAHTGCQFLIGELRVYFCRVYRPGFRVRGFRVRGFRAGVRVRVRVCGLGLFPAFRALRTG